MDTNKNDKQNDNKLLSKKRSLDAKLKSNLIEKKNKIKLIETESALKINKINEEYEKSKEEYFQTIKLEER